jgi:carboxyl-terminal processing protease
MHVQKICRVRKGQRMATQLSSKKSPRWKRVVMWAALALVSAVFAIVSTLLYVNYKNYFANCAVENRRARAYLVDALDLMQAYSVNSDKMDWTKVRKLACETAKSAQTPAETYVAINGTISRLMDFHSALHAPRSDSPKYTAAQFLAYRVFLKIGAGARTGNVPEPSQSLIDDASALPDGERYSVERHGFAMPAQRIGYLALDGFTSVARANMFNYAETLARAVDNILPQSQCGIIVDLRRNNGGNMYPQFLGLHRLYGNGNGKVMGMKERDGRETWVSVSDRSYCHVSGSNAQCMLRLAVSSLPKPDASVAPVAVLLSQATASSAEAVALGFIGRPNTKTFGYRSSGATTANQGFLLQDGAMLSLAVSEMTDRNGKTYPTHIVPDLTTSYRFPFFSAKNADDLANDKTAQAAITWLSSQASCKQ